MTQVPSTVSAVKCSISTDNKQKLAPKNHAEITDQFYARLDTVASSTVLHAG